jgi:hypothetical protein
MTDNKTNLVVVNLSQVELPTFTESKYQDWIKYGADNDFPFKLQDLANRSALHNAILSSKVDNICGNGFTYDKKKDNKTDLFLENINPNETANDVLRKVTYDYELYGGYALNVIWSRDHKTISEVYHIDFAKIRCGKLDEKGQVQTYFYSKDWCNYRKAENEPKQIAAFNTKTKEPSQLIYVKEYRPGMDYYPVPCYVGALAYIEIDVEIANFHLAHIKNGMTPSIMINFNNGIPTDEEQTTIERQITRKYNGTDNAGKLILSFSEDKDKSPTVTTLTPSQLDKQFIQLQSTVLQNILSGHKVVSPLLVGIKTEGQLGGNAELETAYNIYSKTIIQPAQNIILKSFNQIGTINGLQELSIIPTAPIEFTWSENVLATILTKDEMRERIGLEPLVNVLPENNIQ